VAYGAGLRASEVVTLKVSDIDRSYDMLSVKAASIAMKGYWQTYSAAWPVSI
jgi:integrase